MAKSGSSVINITGWDQMLFEWECVSQSAVDNTSTVNWKATLISYDYGRISSTQTKTWYCSIGGETFGGGNTVGIGNNEEKLLASGTAVIPHNADGTKTFNYYYEQEFYVDFDDTRIKTKTITGSGTLDAIQRVAKISSSGGEIGDIVKINFSKVDIHNNLHYKLSYTFRGETNVIVDDLYYWDLDSDVYEWDVDNDLNWLITDAQKDTCVIKCETYAEDKLLGSSTANITLRVNEYLCMPSISATYKDGNTETVWLTEDSSIFVRGFSNLQYVITANTYCDATVVSYSAECGMYSSTNKADKFNKITKNSFTVKITDSRGFTVKQTYNLNMIDYVDLTSSIAVKPPTVSGDTTLTISGSFFNGSFGESKNNADSLAVMYRYKEEGAEDWGEWYGINTYTISKYENSYSIGAEVSGLNYEKTYIFQSRAADLLLTVDSKLVKVKTMPIFDWGEDDFSVNVPLYAGGINLTNLAKAMTTNYTLTSTATPNNYTSSSFSAVLMGNNLRCRLVLSSRRTAAGANTGTGKIDETLASVSINHGGKIKTTYQVDFPVGKTGVGFGGIANAKNDGTNLTFDIVLINAATALGNIEIYFSLPCSLDLNNY
jgi:hypothetical protein